MNTDRKSFVSFRNEVVMSLQFIMGGSGSGKSTWLYEMLRTEAAGHRNKKYIVLVPDQFTLETQKTLVAQGGGILNIDVLSFHRLAYRVFEEVPALQKTVLEDMGKMMLLRSVFTEQKKHLKYFHKGLHKPGFLDECKSFLCELMQYAIDEDDFDVMEESVGKNSVMALKLQDIRLIYRAFREKMGDTYMTAEELVPQLTSVAASIEMLQDAVIVLDGFTGFTPTQYELLQELLICCDRMIVTVTTDRTEKRGPVFSLSTDTITRLTKLANEVHTEIKEPVIVGKGADKIPYRVAESAGLCFLEEHLFSYDRAKWMEPVSDIELVVCRKESGEAACVARKIFWLVEEEGYTYDDIAVVTSDIAAYEQALRTEMDRLGIRYFMDYKKSIGANALAEYLLSFLEMYRKGLDYESTFRFLRSGLSPLSTEETDILENYVMARGRRGIRSYRQEWEYQEERMDLVLVNEYRKKFVDAVDETIRELSGGKKTVREFTEILYRLIVRNHLYEKIQERCDRWEEEGKTMLAGEYRRVYRLMMDLFDELVELLGTETVTFREYEELLSAGISEGLVGFIPPEANQVMIGDVKRSRLKDIKVLFFVGVTDERILTSRGAPGILSENERKKISEHGIVLAPSEEEKTFTEQFYLYLTLTKASEKLILTFARMGEDGSSRRPAYLIRQIQGMFPELSIQEDDMDNSVKRILGSDSGRSYLVTHLARGDFYGKENSESYTDRVWWELAAWHERKEPGLIRRLLDDRMTDKSQSRLSQEAAGMLYGSELYGSVTRLEQFARCPYAYFVIFGLGLKEREQFRIGAADYGNVFHDAMEHFSHELEDENREWQDMSEQEVLELADRCVDFVTDRYRGDLFHQSGRTEFMKVRMKKILRMSVWGIWRQMKAGRFSQLYSEKMFSGSDGLESLQIPLENGKGMVLGGKIDRVDLCEADGNSLIKIMDYKSGRNDIDLCRVYHGLQLQLLTYMAAAIELQKKNSPQMTPVPAAMLYYRMDEPELSWKEESEAGREERMLAALKCTGYVSDNPDVLEKMDADLMGEGRRSLLFPVGFKKDGSFDRYSHILSTEQFEILMQHARKKMVEFGNRIYEGEIGAAPYRMQTESGCDYCSFSDVCGVKGKEIKNCARDFVKMEEENVWEVLYGRDRVDE